MFTIRRRLLAVTALALLAIAQVIPASAGYDSLTYGSCSGYGSTNQYSTYTAADTQGTSGCFKFLQFRYWVPEAGYWYTASIQSGYSSFYYDDVGWSLDGWSTHALGYDDYSVDVGNTYG
ncbi:MAG: hypothetical protein ACSLFM_00345 [Tepidiformaceae bacterium]